LAVPAGPALYGMGDMALEAPLVTCIVPARDAGRYLSEALDSILAQTYRPIEIVLVDDGSKDDTAAIGRGNAGSVRVVSQAPAGPASARNLGVRLARGEFVAFLDADDLWQAEKLARQMAVCRARPGLGYCLAHARNFWEPHLLEEAERFRDHPRGGQLPAYSCGTLLARRDVFDTVGPFDPALRFTDQVDWFLRAADLGVPMEMLPDVFTYRRIHGKNLHRVEEAACSAEFLRLARSRLHVRRAQGAPLMPLDAFLTPGSAI
jgi:glycosyltransferase involved in cell wall biosynthesis